MAATGYRMKYVDGAMKEQKISERSVTRLAYIAEHAPRGRFQIKKETGELWDSHEVRTLEERGLWDVEWLEPGDEDHEGGWRILHLNDVGKNVLRKWRERS
ncbi:MULTISPECIES: hypothetical protein [unclassified Streptomyces]|uniref:hypothetical protein n=1 Tax=unclassified Streptomyces TaxID=2593676 RepID=UPI002E28B63E|nr:hypothetical protein [Streptomyces sp. NBC_00285]